MPSQHHGSHATSDTRRKTGSGNVFREPKEDRARRALRRMMNARWEYEVMEKVNRRAPYQSPGPSHGRAAHEISAFTSLPIKWQ
ncbi:hypothetical protein FOVG_16373 [Fusarium oxysporum f. sp. pisi HDV247]|uniref:Uncharacterized protein n=1 Tax=Fusarium oxysporum f. sp. pisi HDV247 TaxID=1080344 RepID=W9NI22_FUSOX|nr:hypothetical protein FOVG_16373 [Fusarium oxysporum f. sp. pisi HDV247]